MASVGCDAWVDIFDEGCAGSSAIAFPELIAVAAVIGEEEQSVANRSESGAKAKGA